ncbi:Probable RNA-directed DNA polymerase from transposon BS [Eumeta japonica]|uniref:Probable RNA-directed DNA polymerase from transposon BS n=1 Tax=Eumeta variegata TaxID=151549 RepID=A0A4C1TRX4_EUMVA|nr:Probable RNA-directed DNA polymerase from transposon BS [Eumeta japonica]
MSSALNTIWCILRVPLGYPSGNSHGGTAIIIKENTKHYLLEEYKTDKIQATSVRIQDNKVETTLSAIYCPPRHVTTSEDFKNYFKTLGNRYICCGDWNAKHVFWGSRLTSPRGRQLYLATNDLNLHCVSHGVSTYWPADPNKKPDLLDFYVIKNIPLSQLDVEECTDLSSDHTPVIVNVHCQAVLIEYPQRMYNHRTDWDEYRAKITKSVNLNSPLNDVNSIETAIESFNRLIHQAAKESTPFLRQKNLNHFPYPKLIKDKDLKNMISQANNERFQNQLADLTPKKDTNYSLWKITKKLKRPKIHIPPIKTTDGKWVRKEADKAQVFANHLKDVFKPLPSKNTEHDKEVYEYLDAALQMCLPLKSVSPKETWREISKLQEGKTPGYDLVDAKLLKELPEKGIIHFAAICNACLRLAIFPGQWKIAQVVMIPKPGKPLHEASFYRPISLLSVQGKIFERMLLNRMRAHLSDVIPQHQFGFREKHGTIEQIHRITDIISRTLEFKQFCSAVFLDISQAFDRVWHEGLLYKIKKLLPHSFFPILKSYLQGRCFEVKYNNENSPLQKINSGVPQGSILGPVLYLIFTADIPTHEDTITATNADDTALMSVDKDSSTVSAKLQAHVFKVENWLDKWRIRVNQGKSDIHPQKRDLSTNKTP